MLKAFCLMYRKICCIQAPAQKREAQNVTLQRRGAEGAVAFRLRNSGLAKMWPLGPGLLSNAHKRPGAKARFLPAPLFRSLKATAPSDSRDAKASGNALRAMFLIRF
ncbi:hypothetical protein HDF15_003791 [Granulicella mallensis]|uniref:Uncharacterized protein n=1 Tax=Granulicella mallensis TaxID=940614 RepID=A0A7W7ZSQ1_9BACT|nr:hypothetical protein [Granulicella mallensis]